MLFVPPTVRIYLYAPATDMRKSFDGLVSLTENEIRADPMSGHLFAFRNRRGDRVKVLWWDRSGFSLFYKRLELGTFIFPKMMDTYVEVESGDLALILEGIDLRRARRRKRFVPGPVPTPELL